MGSADLSTARAKDRQCTAIKSSGERCGRYAIKGGTVCPTHGGAAPQVRAKANRRLLEELVGPAIAALRDAVDKLPPEDGNRLRAALAILDRTGFGPGSHVDVKVTAFDTLADRIAAEAIVVDDGYDVGRVIEGEVATPRPSTSDRRVVEPRRSPAPRTEPAGRYTDGRLPARATRHLDSGADDGVTLGEYGASVDPIGRDPWDEALGGR